MREIGTPKIGYNEYNEYNEFAYKNTKDNIKFEDRFQENGHFSIPYTQNCI